VSLRQALRVPQAIADSYAKQSTRPLDLAAALDMSPTSGGFRELCGAALGYGLTDGGPNAALISLTALGRRIVAPLEDGDDQIALREAALVPGVEREFLERYDGSPIPSEKVARNVLESLGVPSDATQRVYDLIVENARSVGLLKPIKDKVFVDLGQPAGRPAVPTTDSSDAGDRADPADPLSGLAEPAPGPEPSRAGMPNRRVFLSHGSNHRVVDQLKELLAFGDFEAVVAVERESVSKPVPQKVMDDMRSAAAGIIHVSPEERLMDQAGVERRVLNQNVLIEIGAAMALYGERFILLVEEGTTLPSNLQGLYEVRYSGSELGYDATMKVLKALNQFKSAS
jgi:hypothetical protein